MTTSVRNLTLAGMVAAALLSGTPAAAQEFLDRGTFVVTRGGAEIAREEFAVTRTTGRAEGYRLVSTTRGSGRELQHILDVDTRYVPVSFQQVEMSGGQPARRVALQINGNRLNARVSSSDGESARELPLPAQPVAVILGDDQASAYLFVPRPADGSRPINLIRPASLRPVSGTIEAGGTDTVTVGTRRLQATVFVLRSSDGDERRFWFTTDGSLVRSARPAGGVVATRLELRQ